MQFEWDENKRRSNITKHGIDFVDAALMLAETPFMAEDSRRDYGETRCHALGEYNNLVLHVTFTIRKNVFRIISARRANARERKGYEELSKYDR